MEYERPMQLFRPMNHASVFFCALYFGTEINKKRGD